MAKRLKGYEVKQNTTYDALFESSDKESSPEKNLWCSVIIRAVTDFKTLHEDDPNYLDAKKWLKDLNSKGKHSLSYALDAVISCEKLRRSIENIIANLVSTRH